jgi:hypothetical protein
MLEEINSLEIRYMNALFVVFYVDQELFINYTNVRKGWYISACTYLCFYTLLSIYSFELDVYFLLF